MSVSFRVEVLHAKLFIIIFRHGESSRFEAKKKRKRVKTNLTTSKKSKR